MLSNFSPLKHEFKRTKNGILNGLKLEKCKLTGTKNEKKKTLHGQKLKRRKLTGIKNEKKTLEGPKLKKHKLIGTKFIYKPNNSNIFGNHSICLLLTYQVSFQTLADVLEFHGCLIFTMNDWENKSTPSSNYQLFKKNILKFTCNFRIFKSASMRSTLTWVPASLPAVEQKNVILFIYCKCY